LFVEGLEPRELLAGNVSLSLAGGTLRITGDGQANHVTIYQQANGRFNVGGLDDEVFNTTNTTNLLVRSITVNLGGGDDSVVIAAQPFLEQGGPMLPASVIGAVTLNGGQGSDAMNVSVIGRLIGQIPLPNLSVTVDGGSQNSGDQDDTVNLANTVTGLLNVNTYGGIDTVDLTNVMSLNATVNTGAGSDLVSATDVAALNSTVNLGSITESNTENALTIDGGLFGLLSVNGTNGEETVALTNTVVGLSLNIFTYGGDDGIALTDVHTGLTPAEVRDLVGQLVTALDIDVSQLPFNYATLISRLPGTPGFLNVMTGAGDDLVSLDAVTSTFMMSVLLDSGDDNLLATGVEADFAFFNGGIGTDGQFTDVNDDAILSLLMFENELPDPGQGGTGAA
jgi:hypothetical protein